VGRLVSALKPLHPRLRVGRSGEELAFTFDVRTIENGMNFTLVSDAGNIDLIGRVEGFVDYDHLKQFSEVMELHDGSVRVLTLDGLVVSKKAAGRPKDRLVLPELEALREAQQDDDRDVAASERDQRDPEER